MSREGEGERGWVLWTWGVGDHTHEIAVSCAYTTGVASMWRTNDRGGGGDGDDEGAVPFHALLALHSSAMRGVFHDCIIAQQRNIHAHAKPHHLRPALPLLPSL